MEYRKTLLGAASILALTAGVQGSADASIPAGDKAVKSAPAAGTASDIYSDPLLDLIMRTNGSLSGESIENAIGDMFRNASREQVESFPSLLANISTLGLPPEAVTRLRDVLNEILSSTLSVDDDVRESIIAQLEAATNPIQLAQQQLPRIDVPGRAEPRRRKRQRDPDITGQTPGGGGPTGGGYQ